MTSKAQMALDQAINEIENEWGYEGIKEKMHEIMKPILKDLERLEAIENAKPSEALQCVNVLKEDGCVITLTQGKALETIRQALLKAQEQEKILEILKTILNVSFLYLIKNEEDYNKVKNWLNI